MKARAALVILENGRVALIRRVRDNKTYYVFPGGGLEDGETPEQAAQREAMEELGVRVQLGPCVFETTDAVQEYYYSAVITGGRFGTGNGEEFSGMERGSYEPMWVPIAVISTLKLYPEALAAEILKNHPVNDSQEELFELN